MRILTIFLFFLIAAESIAHMDPPGEIHPRVYVEGEEFHITFGDSFSEEMKAAPKGSCFRKIYTEDGILDGKREVISKDEYLEYLGTPPFPQLETTYWNKFQRTEEINYCFIGKNSRHKPFFYEGIDIPKKKDLNWKSFKIDSIEQFFVADETIAVIAKLADPPNIFEQLWAAISRKTLMYENGLTWFFVFEKDTGEMLFSKHIGFPTYIWFSPRVSNICYDDGTFYFVWNTFKKEEEKNKLHLASYDVKNTKYADSELRYDSHWNISISLATNSKFLCLAYHGIGPELAVEFLPLNSNKAGIGITSSSAVRNPIL